MHRVLELRTWNNLPASSQNLHIIYNYYRHPSETWHSLIPRTRGGTCLHNVNVEMMRKIGSSLVANLFTMLLMQLGHSVVNECKYWNHIPMQQVHGVDKRLRSSWILGVRITVHECLLWHTVGDTNYSLTATVQDWTHHSVLTVSPTIAGLFQFVLTSEEFGWGF